MAAHKQTAHRRVRGRPNHSEITAVLSCYAAIAPSSQITHTYAHSHKRETGTVTLDLAGSEGHRGIVTKLPSNKQCPYISVVPSPRLDLSTVLMNMLTVYDCFVPAS